MPLVGWKALHPRDFGIAEAAPREPSVIDAAIIALDVYAEIFGLFLKQLSLQRVHWIGTSMGGLIAFKMAEKGLASKFRSLTLVDITHKPNHAGCLRLTGYITETLPTFATVEQYTEVLKKNLPIGPVPEYVWRHYAQHQLKKAGDVYAFHFDPKIARMAVPGLKAGIDLTAGLKKVECPVSLVAGGSPTSARLRKSRI